MEPASKKLQYDPIKIIHKDVNRDKILEIKLPLSKVVYFAQLRG
jgi:hypothetical protein